MKDISSLKGFDYAHRGLFDEDNGIGENALAAFQNALAHGYGMELDVQLTKDNIIIVSHDGDLKRLFNKEGEIKNLNYSEVSFLPTLKQVLELVDGQTPIIVELKHYDRAYLLSEMVRDLLKTYRGPYAIESFDPAIVHWFKKNAPEIIRGQLIEKGFHVWQCLYSRPDFIAAKIGTEKTLSMKLGKKLFTPNTVAWTARTKEQMKVAKDCYTLQIFELPAIKH